MALSFVCGYVRNMREPYPVANWVISSGRRIRKKRLACHGTFLMNGFSVFRFIHEYETTFPESDSYIPQIVVINKMPTARETQL